MKARHEKKIKLLLFKCVLPPLIQRGEREENNQKSKGKTK